MNTSPLIFVLVLNYNGRATLPACLRSILRLEYEHVRLVVIDNASTDSSFEKAKTMFARAHFISNSENVGFARGINVGIRFALEQGADLVWIVNPDVVVPKDALMSLVSLMEKYPSVGLVSPRITTPSGRLWFTGGSVNWLRFRAVHDKPKSRTLPFETEFLSGCALLVRRNVFETIGLFDERFFLYYEDADFCRRAKRSGLRSIVHPIPHVTHSEESRHNPDKTYWLVRSGLYFFWKHTPRLLRPLFWLAFLIRRAKNFLRLRKSSRKSIALSIEKAFRDFQTYGY